MKRSLFLFLFLLGMATAAFAQQRLQLKGSVADTAQQPLAAATVVLASAKDSVMLDFAVTDDKGRFSFSEVPPGAYVLQLSFLGKQPLNKSLNISEEQGPLLDLGALVLKEKQEILKTVEISTELIPIVIKGDTVEYAARAFKTEAHDRVEDLLKKLPGIEVEQDGTIKAHGEKVENLLVDGKPFFGNDPKVASKNLPADAIDKVQVFDQLSEMAQFTGVDDGQRAKSINLTLKEGKKGGWFGTLEGGYGTDNRFIGKANLNRFDQKKQFSVLGAGNNINEPIFSFSDFINFAGGLESMQSDGSGGFQAAMPGPGGQQGGIQQALMGGANLNYQLSPKTELFSNYLLSRSDEDRRQQLWRENLFNGSSFRTEEASLLDRGVQQHTFSLRLKHSFRKGQDLAFRTNATLADNTSRQWSTNQSYGPEGELRTDMSQQQQSATENWNSRSTLTYRHLLSDKGRAVVGDFTFGLTRGDWGLGLQREQLTYTPSDPYADYLHQRQQAASGQWNYALALSYLEPLGKRRYLELRYNRQNLSDTYSKDFFDLDGGEEAYNDALSTAYNRGYHYDRGSLHLKINREKSQLTLSGGVQHAVLQGQINKEAKLIEKEFLSLLPGLSYRYDWGRGKNLRVDYATNLTEPSLQQLQPVLDNTDPLRLYLGNSDLQAEYTHRLIARYNFFDQFSFTAFFANLSLAYTRNRITNATFIDETLVQRIQPVNTDYAVSLRGYASYSTPLRALGSKMAISNSATYSQNFVWVNARQDQAHRLNNTVDLSLENRKKERFDVKGGLRLGINSSQFVESRQLNQQFWNRAYYTAGSLKLKHWTLATTLDYAIFSGNSFASRQEIPIWSAWLAHRFLPNQRGQLKFQVFDLLNKNQIVSRNGDLNFVEERQLNALQRYGLLSFSYSLAKMGN